MHVSMNEPDVFCLILLCWLTYYSIWTIFDENDMGSWKKGSYLHVSGLFMQHIRILSGKDISVILKRRLGNYELKIRKTG